MRPHPSALLPLLATVAFGQPADGLQPVFATRMAIDDYDPVTYFTASKPVRGQTQHEFKWKGAKWFFASAENRELFAGNPEKYTPEYGGYCAYAVSQGKTARIDPMAWKIVEGKLYLNFSPKIQKRWEAKQAEYIEQADQNWPKLPKGDGG